MSILKTLKMIIWRFREVCHVGVKDELCGHKREPARRPYPSFLHMAGTPLMPVLFLSTSPLGCAAAASRSEADLAALSQPIRCENLVK